MRVVLAASWLLRVVSGHQILQHQEDSGLSLLQTGALVSHRSREALQEALVNGDSPNLVGAPSPSTRLTGSGYHRGHYKGELDPRDYEKTQQFQEAAWAQAVETQAAREFEPRIYARSSGLKGGALEQKSKRERVGKSHRANTRSIEKHRNTTNRTNYFHQELPANWTAHVDHSTNRTYYYNQETRETSFKVPEAGNKAPRRIFFKPGMEIVVEKSFTTAVGSQELVEGTIGTVRLVRPEGDVLFLFGNDALWLLASELTNLHVHDVDDIVDVEEREAEEFEDVAADAGESYDSSHEGGTQNVSNDAEDTNETYMDEAIKEFGLDPALYGQGFESN